jgi:hypothetical protein
MHDDDDDDDNDLQLSGSTLEGRRSTFGWWFRYCTGLRGCRRSWFGDASARGCASSTSTPRSEGPISPHFRRVRVQEGGGGGDDDDGGGDDDDHQQGTTMRRILMVMTPFELFGAENVECLTWCVAGLSEKKDVLALMEATGGAMQKVIEEKIRLFAMQ